MCAQTNSALGNWLANYQFFCVGSLPFLSARKAVQFIFENSKILPFWPELPRINEQELSLKRAERALGPEWAGYMESEASGLFETLRHLNGRPRLELIKAQLLGPLTLAHFSDSLNGELAQKLPQALEATLKQIDWQWERLRQVAERVLFVLDEPGLAQWDHLSSAEQDMLSHAFKYLHEKITKRGDFLGVHSCAGFLPLLLELPFDLVSFDATQEDPVAEIIQPRLQSWRNALQRGVILAPGVWKAVQGQPYAEARQAGLVRFEALKRELSGLTAEGDQPLMLPSANCGHAFAEAAWVDGIYA